MPRKENRADPMKTAAAYIRVSTDDQIEFSPDSQLKAIRKYAKEHGLILPQEYIFTDEGISGRNAEKRPEFQRMIGTAKLKPKPFDVILLWKFSRFARNREDSIVYKSMLRKQCGIDVISISEQLAEDKTSILIEALLEAMDEYYSLNLAEEVRRGMTEKFSRGGVVSQPPFGYKMQDGIFAPDSENAEIVRMIYSDYLSGMGMKKIAGKLNEMGIKSKNGNAFENRTVEYILTNPVYIGKLRRSKSINKKDRFHQDTENTMLIDGKHQPIISPEVFEAVNQKIKENKKIYSRYARQKAAEYMLKGLVRCDSCGHTLTYTSAGNGLQCHQYSKGACAVSHFITLPKLNTAVIEHLKTDFENRTFMVDVKPQPKSSSKIAVSTLIDRERKKLQRVREAYESGIDSIEEYRENKLRIRSKIQELECKASEEIIPTEEEINCSIAEKIEKNIGIIQSDEVSESTKNLILRSFIDRIIFLKPKGIVEIHYKV